MRFTWFICYLILLANSPVTSAQSKSSLRDGVRVELMKPTQQGALFHWKITNTLETAVYVYDFYLWGPAYHVERAEDRVIFETTPVVEEASCPPYRFPPVLLLVVAPRRTIEGEFTDAEIRDVQGKLISMKIAVGS